MQPLWLLCHEGTDFIHINFREWYMFDTILEFSKVIWAAHIMVIPVKDTELIPTNTGPLCVRDHNYASNVTASTFVR